MLVKVDWLSFSVLLSEVDTPRTVIDHANHCLEVLQKLHPDILAWLGYGDVEWGSGRKPYSHSVTWADHGITLFFNPRLPHALVEISGKGCDYVDQIGHGVELLEAVKHRATRIDIAADMLTDVDPLTFTAKREEGRFKSHSEATSESGTTAYIGSRTSNRYARVYRYNDPHPRAHLLRSEFVLKAQDAKLTIAAILNDGLLAVAKKLGEQFGWLHDAWNVDEANETELKAYRPERREGKTLFWLHDTIAPLLARLHLEGQLDMSEFFSVVQQHIDQKSNHEE